jgi:hypothetical protein
MTRFRRPFAVALIALAGSGCAGSSGSITADTTCSEYLKRPAEERHDAAVRISSEISGVSSPGNPMWGFSLDGACGSAPDATVGQFFRHGN